MNEKEKLTNEELSQVSGGWGEEKSNDPKKWENSEGATSGEITGDD